MLIKAVSKYICEKWRTANAKRLRSEKTLCCVHVYVRDAAAQVLLRLQQRSSARSHQRHVSTLVVSQSEWPREELPAGRGQGPPEVAIRQRGKIVAGDGRGQGRKELHGHRAGSSSYRFLTRDTRRFRALDRSPLFDPFFVFFLWQTEKEVMRRETLRRGKFKVVWCVWKIQLGKTIKWLRKIMNNL